MWSFIICDNSKVDPKRNWVKFKSVRTLLRITWLADRKSYVVIICASSCEKLTKSEIGSSFKSIQILFKITSIVPRKSYLLIIYTYSYDNRHDSGDTVY